MTGIVAAVYSVPMGERMRSLRTAVCWWCFDHMTGGAPWRLYDWPDDALVELERTHAELQAASDLGWLLSQCDATLLTKGVTLAQLQAEAASLEDRRTHIAALLGESPATRAN
jgi:hypothetical protein